MKEKRIARYIEGDGRMAEKEDIARDFQFLKDKVLAVLIFGSSTEGEGRDIDICIVAPDGFDIKEVFKRVDVKGKKYDVWTFEELPLYMKMEVIQNHLIVICKDVPELFEYFYQFRKTVERSRKKEQTNKRRNKLHSGGPETGKTSKLTYYGKSIL